MTSVDVQKAGSRRLGPGTFWYWNGNPTPGGIRQQLKSMKDAGYSCVYIHPMPDAFGKKNFKLGMQISYLGEKYFRLIKLALAECKKLGLYLMLYDEGGWPSGGVLGRMVREYPDSRAHYLKKDESGNIQEVIADIPDLMNRRTTEYFIEMVHEKYYKEMGEEFGKTILGIFTDEPFWRSLPGGEMVRVAPEMPEMFRNMYGCSFEKDILPHIFAGAPDTAEREDARRKYIHVCSLLIRENYSAVLARWCEEHHIDLEGHFDNEDRFIEIGSFGEITEMLDPLHVPGVDAIWRQIYPGKSIGNYARLAAAAAIRNRRHEALCECFNVYGYFLTSPVMTFVSGALLSKGINRLLPMPYLYGDRGLRKVCCGTDLSPRNPVWNAMPALNDYWRWAGDYDTGALQPEVWLLAYIRHPAPDDWETRHAKNLAVHQEMEEIIAKLDNACVFWRFADRRDLQSRELPRVLVLPYKELDDDCMALIRELEARGVRILKGWELPDMAEYACMDVVENPGCKVLPCLRESGEARMIFNPEKEERIFRFSASGAWGEILPPDPVLQECFPLEEKDGVYQLVMPPFGIRILQKDVPLAPAQNFTVIQPDLQWRISKVQKMSYSLQGASVYCNVPPPEKVPTSGFYTDLDPEFSGIVTYRTELVSEKACTAYIRFDSICHCGSLKVNRKPAGLRAFAPWIFKVQLRKGKNTLELAVSGSGGNEWRRCFREELNPAGYSNGYSPRLCGYEVDDAECGFSGKTAVWIAE